MQNDTTDDALERYGPALARVAASYARSRHDRDDLLQDILVAVWRALPRFRGACSLRTYLFRIAHNRGLQYVWRLRGQRERERAQIDDDGLVDGRPGPLDCAEGASLESTMQEAVRRLPLGQRQVMTMVLEGCDHAEIADVLGIAVATVAVRLHRARTALKRTLEEVTHARRT